MPRLHSSCGTPHNAVRWRLLRLAAVLSAASLITVAAAGAAMMLSDMALSGMALSGMALSGKGFPPAFDLVALATGLASAYLIREREPLGWWIGIVTQLATAAAFFSYDLPGQAWFQILYAVPLQIYGCITWSNKSAAGELTVGTLHGRDRTLCLLAYIVGAISLGAGLQWMYGGAFSAHLWDGAIVAGCVLAQTLLASRKIEAWASWIVLVNAPSIALHIHNGAWLYVVLYGFFTANALIGYIGWRRIHMSAHQPTIATVANSIE